MLTRSGLGALVVALCLAVFGWLWSYEELLIVAMAILVIVVLAIWVSRRRLRASVTRRIIPVRVARGDPVTIVHHVRNDGRFPTGNALIIDQCGDAQSYTAIAPVAGNSLEQFPTTLATNRRGVFPVGPFRIERIDPFSLAVGSRRDDAVGSVTVTPKVYPLVGPSGVARIVESDSVLRRAATDPMSGFVSLREYVPGDDPRTIHWPTTARVGTLMVRENVEVRRPEFTVIVDASSDVASPVGFEEIVDVAASIASLAINSGLDVIVRTTHPDHMGSPSTLRDDGAMLDFLTPVQQATDGTAVPLSALFVGRLGHTSVVLVTGQRGPLSGAASLSQMLVLRIGEGAEMAPGIALAAENAREFVTKWRQLS